MAKKTGHQAVSKDCSFNKKFENLPDEIALRDEILELKRQVMVLRRTNEQYSVKLRKYENEAKRKDKQLEQLLDPRKNADVTKVLSTKGAAILLSLKDQNEALIQMMLNKDVQIRKLVAEIKMSKLYASTRRNENFRGEVNRIRDLLRKWQEMLTTNVDSQSQTRSIYVTGNPVLEFSSSSDQSSPRDLDELRVTILSLESHIKQSNELLLKKNQEIQNLSDELNFLRKYIRYKSSKNPNFSYEYKNDNTRWSNPIPTKGSSTFDLADTVLDSKDQHFSHSAPAASPCDSTPKYFTEAQVQTDRELQEKNENVQIPSVNFDSNTKPNETQQCYTKTVIEKWKSAFKKYKQLKKANAEIYPNNARTMTTTATIQKEETSSKTNPTTECQKVSEEIQVSEAPNSTWESQYNRGMYNSQSFDSDSDCSYSMRQMQVEVQINTVSPQSDSEQSRNSICENHELFENERDSGGNRAPDPDFNDDDDVVVREK